MHQDASPETEVGGASHSPASLTIPVFLSIDALPFRLGHLVLEEVETLPEHDQGVRIRYSSEVGIKADVFLYSQGHRDLEEGTESSLVESTFSNAFGEVTLAARKGCYANLEVMATGVLDLVPSNQSWLWAAFRYLETIGYLADEKRDQVSHLAVRVTQSYITKIRYSYPGIIEHQEFQPFTEFLSEWQAAITHGISPSLTCPDPTIEEIASQRIFTRKVKQKTQRLPDGFFNFGALAARQDESARSYLRLAETVGFSNARSSLHPDKVNEGINHEMAHAFLRRIEMEMAIRLDTAGFPQWLHFFPSDLE